MVGRITLYTIFVFALASVCMLVTHFVYYPTTVAPTIESIAPRQMGPLSTNTWGVFDLESGELLMGSETKQVRPIASVTKLFTAYAALQSGKADIPTYITWADIDTEGRAGKLNHGEVMTPHELLFPLLLESSNDAGEAIRRTLGNDFVLAIDDLRNSMELTHTEVVDGSGLSSRNVSEVEELARFYTYLHKAHPHIIDITRLQMYIDDRTGYVNNSPARDLSTYTGGKHGYTPEAGRTFLGSFVLPLSEREVGVVILGSEDLVRDLTELITRADEELSPDLI